MSELCLLCSERPASVRVSWLDKSEPMAGAVAQYKLCADCSEAEPNEAKLLSICDKRATAAQREASRPAEQLRLMV